MNIGIAKEIKPFEGRVALTPKGCHKLISQGHKVFVEKDAGLLSCYNDSEYQQNGVTICSTAKSLYEQCSLIIKVKEPITEDLHYLTKKHTLFCFLHLAANPTLAKRLMDIGLTAIAFETLRDNNILPILKPMSEIAGKLAVQIGSNLLHLTNGGLGLLIGGVGEHAIEKGQILVLGAGSAGRQSALLAQSMGADVIAYDHSEEALSLLKLSQPDIRTCSDINECIQLIPTTDLMIGALHVAGKKSPRLITREHVKTMKKGSVIIDISVDQGGCIETTKRTNYDDPTYVTEGVTHFCVANMPGAVPRTATQALSSILPHYIEKLTKNNYIENDDIMKNAVNIIAHKCVL